MRKLSTDDKIDYIYNQMRMQDRRQQVVDGFKWFMRFCFVGFVVYFYLFGYDQLKEEIVTAITPDITIPDTSDLIEKTKKFFD